MKHHINYFLNFSAPSWPGPKKFDSAKVVDMAILCKFFCETLFANKHMKDSWIQNKKAETPTKNSRRFGPVGAKFFSSMP